MRITLYADRHLRRSLPFRLLEKDSKPLKKSLKSRWPLNFRFSLKSLLGLMTLSVLAAAIVARPFREAQQKQWRRNQAVELGATVSQAGSLLPKRQSLLQLVDSHYGRNYLFRLDFSKAKLDNEGLQKLTTLPLFPIYKLILSDTQITDAGLVHLQNLPFLRSLDLSGTKVTDKGIERLALASQLLSLKVERTVVSYQALEKLEEQLPDAHFCEQKAIVELTAAGAQLGNSPRIMEETFTSERYGSVWSNYMDVEMAHRFVAGGGNQLRAISSKQIGLISYLSSLDCLELSDNSLGSGGFMLLKKLPRLRSIEIRRVNLTNEDLGYLSRQTQLESLSIHGCNNFYDESLVHLAKLIHLKELTIRGCEGVRHSALDRLAQQLPNCQCHFHYNNPN